MSVVDDVAEHLLIALKMLDEAGHYLAAAHVASALDSLGRDDDSAIAEGDSA